MNHRIVILLAVSIVLSLLSAVLAFGWFGSTADANDVLGLLGLSVAAFAASRLP